MAARPREEAESGSIPEIKWALSVSVDRFESGGRNLWNTCTGLVASMLRFVVRF